MLEIEASVRCNGPSSEHCVKNLRHDRVVVPLTTKTRVYAEVKLGEYKYQVFVKSVKDQVRIASVWLPAMHENQWLQEGELLDAEVCSGACLCSLCSSDSNANVCFFNHRHVVCPITYSQNHLTSMLPYYGNQVRLLLWRHAACNHRLTLWNQILKKI